MSSELDSKIEQILNDCTEEDWVGDDETRVTELNKEKAIPAIRTLITTESIQLLERLKEHEFTDSWNLPAVYVSEIDAELTKLRSQQ